MRLCYVSRTEPPVITEVNTPCWSEKLISEFIRKESTPGIYLSDRQTERQRDKETERGEAEHNEPMTVSN